MRTTGMRAGDYVKFCSNQLTPMGPGVGTVLEVYGCAGENGFRAAIGPEESRFCAVEAQRRSIYPISHKPIWEFP